jgi:hypothetical protein
MYILTWDQFAQKKQIAGHQKRNLRIPGPPVICFTFNQFNQLIDGSVVKGGQPVHQQLPSLVFAFKQQQGNKFLRSHANVVPSSEYRPERFLSKQVSHILNDWEGDFST